MKTESLSPESSEGDLISREAAIEVALHVHEDMLFEVDPILRAEIAAAIRSLPAATAVGFVASPRDEQEQDSDLGK